MEIVCKIVVINFYLLNLVIAQTVDIDVPESFSLLPTANANVNVGLSSTDSFQDQDSFKMFGIQKDPSDPSRLLNVFLPPNFHQFNQFIAKVTDISPEIDFPVRDVNRTFLASPTDSSVINIHGLNAGHKYSISVLGRVEAESRLIKEESVTMDPLPLNFDSNESIQATHHNITMHATKPEKALQDTFRVEYVQLDPPRRFPILDVHDISDQKHVELYLGNLNPGRDYDVTVTSMRGELPSHPWKGMITTKPLRPTNLAVIELNATCISLSWTLTSESGADRFKIAYGILHGDSSMTKIEVPYSQHQANICRDILPGQTFIFAVIAEKSHQISDPATISYTVKPLAPTDVQLVADFEKEKFRLNVELPPKKLSKIEKCHVSILSEQLERSEQTVSAFEEKNHVKCVAYMDLIPGRRYEVSASTISSQATSTKMFRSLALEPGFDMKAFGLLLQEEHGVIRLEWPTNEAAIFKVHHLWSKIVGNDSLLHVKIEPLNIENITNPVTYAWKETIRQIESSPSANRPVYIDHLRRGACYKIYMYTVTSSGIVSTRRFEEYFRLSAPEVELKVTKISKNTGVVQIVVPNSTDRLHPISSYFNDCNLNVVVLDMHSMIVYDKTIVLIDSAVPPILLEGLRPFHKYTINSQIICGQSSEQNSCPPKMRTMHQLTFETRQDKPGPVQNLTVKALNPYSVQISWLPPALPNGIITHYIITVTPTDLSEKPWTLNVGANIDTKLDHFMEAVVDNLVGGQVYQMGVQAVTEAGAGDIPAQSEHVKIEMPIMAPPRPSSRIEILPNTVRSMDLTIRYNTVMFSTKHGLLTKAAIIVAQVSPDGKTNENWLYDRANRTTTWGQVQRFDIWPPYMAVETPIEPLKHFSPKPVSEVIGIDATCSDDAQDTVCNGPLKPASGYRFKLRLYTAPNLWTDTLYSDVVVTEPQQVGATFRSVFLALFLLLIGGALSLIFLVLYNRHKNKKVPPCFGSTGRNGINPNSTYSSKENQWNALKMIMAERLDSCLAKLGLDSTSPPSSANSVTVSCAVSANANDDGIRIASPPNGLATANCFNAHHRRSRSLRERTGVDQRLERLPSGPPPSQQKTVPWTVIKGANIEKSRPIRISDFAEHVRLMSADSDFRFSEEYEDLRLVGHGQPCIAADLTVNRAKNRFTNILPYDHSRVKLIPTDDEDGSDYINANYVPGFNSRREFIAAQGPLPSTRDHFWRVVWEQQCPAIVALTKCIEKGRDKCHQYWPDNNQRSLCFGDIEVTLLNETIDYDDLTIRELRLTNLSENGPQAARNVLHFHYMAWPDFGVPDHPSGIVHFVKIFRARIPGSIINQAQTNKPCGPRAIVHCSAGVGRSGTFISVVRGLENIEANRPIDIYGSVYEMRLERCHMVQNEQQYIFIHQCLLFALENTYPHLLNPTAMSFFNGGAPNAYSQMVNGSDSLWITSLAASGTAPRIEVHQNPAFIEDDEGIAESGL